MNRSPFSRDSELSKECREVARLLGAYIDGELDAAQLLEIEGHVARCEACRERVELDRAMRGTLKKVVKEGAEEGRSGGLAAMRARMAAAMGAEKARGEARERDEEQISPKNLPSWRVLAPLSAAAALA